MKTLKIKLIKVGMAALLLLALQLPQIGISQTINLPTLPINNEGKKVAPLRDLQNTNLQTDLTRQMNSKEKWKKLISQKNMAVGIVDLRDLENVRFASVNGNEMMYAASLPKIAILLASMDALEKGELDETAEIKSDLRLMISKSNNAASTRMIDRLGYDKIESVLQDPQYELYDKEYGGGLWVGKRYAKTGERHPDPIKGISHGASVTQVCRYYYLLVNGKLVNYDRSKEMLGYMQDPELHHKFVNTLETVAPRARLFRKSGTWSTYHSDSILVWGPDRKYILVALLNDPNGETILRNLVKVVDKILTKPLS